MWFDGVLLRFGHGSLAGDVGDETLVVTDDGAVWLWVARAADPARADVVGTFTGRASPEQLDEARQLARSLAGPVVRLGGAPPQAVTASSPHGSLVVPHSAVDPLATRLRTLSDALTASALEMPAATARFAGLVSRAEPPQAHLAVHGEGAAGAVRLLVDPGRSAVQWLDESGGALSSGPLPPPPMGLVDGTAALLDGLRRPAELRDGVAGALTVAVAPPAGARALALRVAGRLTFLAPGGVEDLPEHGFEASTSPAPVPQPG